MLNSALGDKYNTPVASATPSQITAVSAIFTQTCAVFHGASGKRDVGSSKYFPIAPSHFTNKKESHFYSDQGRMEIIKNGIPGTQMPGWGTALNEEQVFAVYSYVRSLRNKDWK